MEYINHFTMNTGHSRKSYPSEIDKKFFFQFVPIINEIIKDGGICEYIIDETYMRITPKNENCYFASLYIKNNGEYVPMFASAATSDVDMRVELISYVSEYRELCSPPNITFMPPEAPLIIDMILPSIFMRTDLLRYTGDMSRCLAWAMLGREDVLMY